MTKIVLSILVILFTWSSLFAQKGKIELSVSNGFNYSNFDFKPTKGSKVYSKMSYRYGIGIKKAFSSHFYIGTEINMEEKGWLQKNLTAIETSVGIIGTLGDSSANFYYPFVSIPIFFNYEIKNKKTAKCFVESGFLTNIRRPGSKIITPSPTIIVASNINPEAGKPVFDFGFFYGIGVKRNIYKNWSLGLTSRYAFSITGIGSWGIEKKYLHHKNYTALLALSYTLKKETKK